MSYCHIIHPINLKNIPVNTNRGKKIIDKYVSGSDAPVDLNIDYSNYENFINFSMNSSNVIL